MARKAFSGALSGGGFQPIQLSQAELTRMAEEDNRVINNMERIRQEKLQQGKDVLQAKKENALAEDRQRERDYRIQQYNLQVGKLELEHNQQKAQEEYRQNVSQFGVDYANEVRRNELIRTGQSGASAVLKGLSDFSKGAAQLIQKVEVEQEKNQMFKETLEFMGLTPLEQVDPLYDAMEKGLQIQGLQYSQSLSLAEGSGGDPNSIARAREGNPALRYASKKSGANWMLMNQFEGYLNSILTNTDYKFDFNGQSVTFAEARSNPRLMAAVQRFAFKKFVDENELRLDRRFIQEGLNHVQKVFAANEGRAGQIEIANSYARQVQTADAILSSQPGAFNDNIPLVYNTWKNILGYAGALDKYTKLVFEQAPDGSFRYDMNQLGAADLKGTGKTFMEEFPNRWSEMIRMRDQALIQHEQTTKALDGIGYERRLKDTMEFLSQEGNNTQANYDAAVKAFKDLYPERGVPRVLLEGQASGTIEVEKKLKLTEQLLAINPAFLTFEDVAAAYQTDPQLGKTIDQRYQGKTAVTDSPVFKETLKTFKTAADAVSAVGSAKPDGSASQRVQLAMKEDLLKKVAVRLKEGVDIETAIILSSGEVEATVKAGANDPNSKYYRKLAGPGGAVVFPKINTGLIKQAEAQQRAWTKIKQDINTKGLDAVLGSPGALFSKEEGEALLKKAGTPYFTLPKTVTAVAGLTRGGDPFYILNRQLQANGLPAMKPPAAFTKVQKKADPRLMKILMKDPSVNLSARTLGSVRAFDPGLVPNNLGPVIQTAAQNAGVNPTYVAALAEIESTFKADNVSYNGSSFGLMQINKAYHPAFFAQQNWKDPQANANYGAKYYAGLLKKYKDPVAAAMAYNAGPGNYDAYLQGRLPDGPIKTEMLNHGKKFARVMYKYGDGTSLNNPALMRSGHSNLQLTSSANSFIGMDTSDGPDIGRNACVWAVNKVMRAAGMNVPWGNSLYVPEVKRVLDSVGKRVNGPVPGAIAIMQDNHPTDPYPHMGIVRSDGNIISNSSSRAKFDWVGTPQEYEQKYGRSTLYYLIN